MTVEADRILRAALELSTREREELVERLEQSLGDGTPQEIEAAWIAEAKRRLADTESGETTPVSADSTLAMMDEVIERARARRTG